MSDFAWAQEQMAEDKEVRRSGWAKDDPFCVMRNPWKSYAHGLDGRRFYDGYYHEEEPLPQPSPFLMQRTIADGTSLWYRTDKDVAANDWTLLYPERPVDAH
jgi:hypothetical protein